MHPIDPHGPRVNSGIPHILPPKKVVPQASDMRRYKAFRMPLAHVAGCLLGYQGKADEFTIYRVSPGLLPEGFKIVGAYFEHPRNDFYIMIEHPSFPEIPSGEKLEAVEITIDELDVQLTTTAPRSKMSFKKWCHSHAFAPDAQSAELTALYEKTSG